MLERRIIKNDGNMFVNSGLSFRLLIEAFAIWLLEDAIVPSADLQNALNHGILLRTFWAAWQVAVDTVSQPVLPHIKIYLIYKDFLTFFDKDIFI